MPSEAGRISQLILPVSESIKELSRVPVSQYKTLIMKWQLCMFHLPEDFFEDLKCYKFAPCQLFLDRVKQFRELSSLPLPLDHLDKNNTPDDK